MKVGDRVEYINDKLVIPEDITLVITNISEYGSIKLNNKWTVFSTSGRLLLSLETLNLTPEELTILKSLNNEI